MNKPALDKFLLDVMQNINLSVSVNGAGGRASAPVHLGNVWACKDTVIVILVSAPAPFPWSWVGDWGLKAG